MQLFYCPDVLNDACYLNSEESKHCIKVLRKTEGDLINLIDGQGKFYEVVITIASQKKVSFDIQKTWREKESDYSLHIAIAPTKNNDRLEWFLEKATEIGVAEITPIVCQNSERRIIKHERLMKIILSATKQSLKAKVPKLNPIQTFKEFVSTKQESNCFIAHCKEEDKTYLKNVISTNNVVLIGPEGDFTSTEIDLALKQNYKAVSLGNSRLRTETAGLVACNTIALHYEKN